ncbi:MerR family transcriptional regulator [Lysinibacter sp. HNR]|uniref:transcriptional regulator FtsR n=1 Tax=Lysinibacter sp. HNR TaxID=3031408 RepID=UPI0024351ED1|nr:MerR family transcriptional regulator [Lysinibacter sp. HNR]WGD38637.1 MerR family transcriptional regulator [Lysinibacter sp. HNR]
MPVSARQSENRTRRLLGIGQVLTHLNPDFPDLTPSKLRFLEEQGLITPARTKSGYRKFSDSDVERLRLILTMQRDHYLPLKVIYAYLSDIDAGREPTLPGGVGTIAVSILPVRRVLTRELLLREAGATPMLLSDAVSAGLLPAAESYKEDSLEVLRALVSLQRLGIEPRHLRSIRAAAEREADLIESALLPVTKQDDGVSRARASDMATEIVSYLEVVRGSIMRTTLQDKTRVSRLT